MLSLPANSFRRSKYIMTSLHRFSRRTFLHGTGVTLTLPLLEAMTSSRAQAATANEPPRRMICINTTLGLHTPNLFPAQAGRDYELTPYLEPIQEFRDDLTVFSGLSHPDVDGGHPAEMCYLTSAPHPRADNFKNTISLDQYAIEQLVPDTRFGSLVLASSSSRGLSFTRSGVPIPAEERPSRIFRNMFVAGTPAEVSAQVQRLKQGQSVMDTVLGEVRISSAGSAGRTSISSTSISRRSAKSSSGWSKPRNGRAVRSRRSTPGHRSILPARLKSLREYG